MRKIKKDYHANWNVKDIFFSGAVKNLKIPEFIDTNSLAERLSNPTLKAILKLKNYPSLVVIKNTSNNFYFHFNEVSVEEIYKDIKKLNPRKSAQSNNRPIRVL